MFLDCKQVFCASETEKSPLNYIIQIVFEKKAYAIACSSQTDAEKLLRSPESYYLRLNLRKTTRVSSEYKHIQINYFSCSYSIINLHIM